MTTSSTETIIREAAQTGVGTIDTRDLQVPDGEFGWQQARLPAGETYAGQDTSGPHVRVAIGRDGTPHGKNLVLVSTDTNPNLIHVYDRNVWRELTAAIRDGQFGMLD